MKLVWRTLGVWVLLLPGVVVLQPAFGGWSGFLPGLAGITFGCAIAWLAARLRWSAVFTVLAVVLTYLLLGGAVALPRTTIAGFVPTVETVQRLVLLLWQGWLDLLTVSTPAGDFTGPAAVPWLAGLTIAAIAGSIVNRTQAVLLPLLAPLAWLAFGIIFGVRLTPSALWLGGALGVGMLAWVWAHNTATERNDNADILVNRQADSAYLIRQSVAALVMVALTAAGAIGATWVTGQQAQRWVLRDVIAPPLDLRNYPSPLMSYRGMKLDLKDNELFTVHGMPKDARLRLAVLDTYDGNVFNVAQESSHYLRTGRQVAQDIQANAELDITVGEYHNVWVPLAGQPRWLEYHGDRSAVLADGTYYNRASGQMLSTAELNQGDSYSLHAAIAPELTQQQRDALGAKAAGQAPLAKLQLVPEILTTLASEYTEGAESAYDQLVTIEQKLLQEGYYADGSDGKSRSGHTTERLSAMFRNVAIIGDDEQYATAMAIMANQLGIPARVVMGFYPKEHPGDTWKVTGADAHVWVEANFADVGWVAFNPTPERPPETEVPDPKPRPKPQMDPPPNPPERVPEEPVLADQDPVDKDDNNNLGLDLGLLLLIASIVGILALLASPFVLILMLKARRATRRRTAPEVHDQLAGGWDEVVDRARDLGYPAASSQTRRQAAQHLQEAYPQVEVSQVAHEIDASLFGPGALHPADAEKVWAKVGEVKTALMLHVAWYRRPLAALSLRSLRKLRVAPPAQATEVLDSKPQEDADV